MILQIIYFTSFILLCLFCDTSVEFSLKIIIWQDGVKFVGIYVHVYSMSIYETSFTFQTEIRILILKALQKSVSKL